MQAVFRRLLKDFCEVSQNETFIKHLSAVVSTTGQGIKAASIIESLQILTQKVHRRLK